MTLVFQAVSGYLQQIQIGPTDIVSTLSAAQSVYGWLGGLDSVQRILSALRVSVSKPFVDDSRFRIPLELTNLETSRLTGQVFTGNGPVRYIIEGGGDPGIFGPDFSSKLIGLSICAISYECGDQQAVHLFMRCLAPTIFSTSRLDAQVEVLSALHGILLESSPKIVNEGAARGLTTLFSDTLKNQRLPSSERQWVQENRSSRVKPFPLEVDLVGGLLKWLTINPCTTYFTRSNLVARVAICLKAVGYLINGVKSWDGRDSPPQARGATVILVTGGSSETDPLMLSGDDEIPQHPYYHHYSKRTVGAMLSNSTFNLCNITPETFQTVFDRIYNRVDDHLSYEWISAMPESRFNTEIPDPVRAVLTWKPWKDEMPNRTVATRLAAIKFPRLAETLAFCYEGVVDNEKSLKEILQFDKHRPLRTTSKDIVLFRAVTASIVISIVAKLSGETFEKFQHLTVLQLTLDTWLNSMCRCIDKSEDYLSHSDVVILLAAVHAGAEPSSAFRSQQQKVIGWRNGIYAVVPSLLAVMAPTKEAIGLRCTDRFWGNAVTHEDGSIRAGNGTGILEHTSLLESIEASSGRDVQSLHGPYLGPPIPAPPDIPLYLNFEKPTHYSSRDLCMRGRVHGEPVGTVAILSIIQVLIRSLAQPVKCSGHVEEKPVFVVRPSVWAAESNTKPVGGSFHSFVPVRGDNSWALFLAGETEAYSGKIVFECPQCAGDPLEKGSVLIGFG